MIDGDISSFFDNLEHDTLLAILRKRVKDGRVLQCIEKWLQAGILDGKEMVFPDKGSPQGSVISPLLANVYLHEVLDTWFETVVKAHCRGQVVLYRYADDFLIGCELAEDARRIKEVLPKRFAKYGLEINAEKTTMVDFGRPQRRRDGRKPGTFSFLGFVHDWGKTWGGGYTIKRKTEGKRLRAPWASFGVGAGTIATVPSRNSTRHCVRSCVGTTSTMVFGVTASAWTWCTMGQRAPGVTG